jgi:hypothetical protein
MRKCVFWATKFQKRKMQPVAGIHPCGSGYQGKARFGIPSTHAALDVGWESVKRGNREGAGAYPDPVLHGENVSFVRFVLSLTHANLAFDPPLHTPSA